MNKLPFTFRTAGGDTFDSEFRLHPHTASGEHVGALANKLLDELTHELERLGGVGNGDVLQALAIVLAIRGRIIDAADPAVVQQLSKELLETAMADVQPARPYQSGSA